MNTGVFRGMIRGEPYREISLAGLTGSDTRTLTVEECKSRVLVLTGAISSGAPSVAFPNVAGLDWLVIVACTWVDGTDTVALGTTTPPAVSLRSGEVCGFTVYNGVLYPQTGPAVANSETLQGWNTASAITVPAGASYSLPIAKARSSYLEFTGGDQACAITVPRDAGSGFIYAVNNTTAFALTLLCNSDGGAGVTIAAGKRALIVISSAGAMTRLTADNP